MDKVWWSDLHSPFLSKAPNSWALGGLLSCGDPKGCLLHTSCPIWTCISYPSGWGLWKGQEAWTLPLGNHPSMRVWGKGATV